MNIKFKNPNWHEAHRLDIYKAQPRHGVQLRATILSKKVLHQLYYRPVTKGSLVKYIREKKNKSGNILL